MATWSHPDLGVFQFDRYWWTRTVTLPAFKVCFCSETVPGEMMQCLMDHIVLNMEDDEKMIGFYSEILMLPTERLEEYLAGKVPFPSVRLNSETIIDLFPKKLWRKSSAKGSGRENLNHFCFSMSKETWEDLSARLNASHVIIEEGPVPRWGAQGSGTSIYFRDPEGNLVEARYYLRMAEDKIPDNTT